MALDERELRRLASLEDACESISAGNPMLWNGTRQDEIRLLRAEVERLREELQQTDNTLTRERSEWASEAAALEGEIAELEEERRWRAFPANAPDANGRYVCMWADGDIYIQRWETGKWLGAFDHEITHWQPLPAPPDKEEEE